MSRVGLCCNAYDTTELFGRYLFFPSTKRAGTPALPPQTARNAAFLAEPFPGLGTALAADLKAPGGKPVAITEGIANFLKPIA